MAQYINKSALLAEIERIQNTTMDKNKNFTSSYDEGKFDALTLLENYIDTLEVKEVDYGIEVHKYAQEHFNVYDDANQTLQTKENKTLLGRKDFEDISKHFFELGLKAKEE